ncbi:MBL fold metallo-hydrolase [Oceanobacillus piezotolerans]|uniref:MBL fold metallo-hydrolase n=1 Tax=Oceanobacillus piezotolerans TaxID=2448030 RepID=A0A498D5W9_9BACI|nr:MBL fold metallo-hydrolase [Oceanobacillus piezotolerans]RLL45108.1 MBL fold metallo-hydrolase [Oceanobacillus piezotolerans]
MQENVEIIPIMVDTPSNLKTTNFYLVKEGSRIILVDAGWNHKTNWQALLDKLDQYGWTIKDIDAIVLTHNHIDHVGLINQIIALNDVPIYAQEHAIPRLKRDPAFFNMRVEFYTRLYEEMGCGKEGERQINLLLEKMRLNEGMGIHTDIKKIEAFHTIAEIIHTPGHSPDQIAILYNQRQDALVGDLLIQHISSNALVEPDPNGERLPTLLQHYDSLQRIREIPIKRAFSGHGKIIEDVVPLIDKRLSGIVNKSEKLKDLIAEGHLTAADIAQTYYKKLYETQFSLVMSEIIGHLDYLEDKGEVGKEKKGGIWHYSLIG